VDGLIEHATQELRALAPDATISLYRVPGAFEFRSLCASWRPRKARRDHCLRRDYAGRNDHAQNLSRSVTTRSNVLPSISRASNQRGAHFR
jgi:hypothetical protein